MSTFTKGAPLARNIDAFDPPLNSVSGFRWVTAELVEKEQMNIVKGLCTVVPVVLITATAVIGIGVVIGLSSWELL